jgi:hypothetical protein
MVMQFCDSRVVGCFKLVLAERSRTPGTSKEGTTVVNVLFSVITDLSVL